MNWRWDWKKIAWLSRLSRLRLRIILLRYVLPNVVIFAAALFVSLAGHNWWTTEISLICAPEPRNLTTELIQLYNMSESIRRDLSQVSKNLGGSAIRFYVYERGTYATQYQVIGSVDPDSNQDRPAYTQDPIAGQFLESQLLAHKTTVNDGGCFLQDVARLHESPFKRKAMSQNTTLIASCPIYNNQNFLVGHIQISFEGQERQYVDVAIIKLLRSAAVNLEERLVLW